MNFFKTFFASCLGTLVALVLLVLIGVFVIASFSDETAVVVAEGSVLHLRLEAPISELELEDPLAELFPAAADQTLGLIRLKQVIEYAKTDPKIFIRSG